MTGLTPGEARGWAARLLLAEDARWVGDVVLSAAADERSQAYPALLLGHHFVRIVFEGSQALQSAKPEVGWPPLANILQHEYGQVTSRVRHMAKLLDDTKRSHDQVLAEMEDAKAASHVTLTGNAHPWFRWAETDLGLYQIGSSVVGASIPMAYRLALDPGDLGRMAGENLHAVTHEWGSTIAVLAAAALDVSEMRPTLALDVRIKYRDRLASRYLKNRYEPDFDDAEKLLLLMIEGDLNTNRLYLPLTQSGHEGPCLRARIVTTYHSLTALRHILDRHPGLDTAGTRSIRGILADPAAKRLCSHDGKMVRNRSVHYKMDDPSIIPDFNKPMFGIIEAVAPSFTWETLDTDLRSVEGQLADALGSWGK